MDVAIGLAVNQSIAMSLSVSPHIIISQYSRKEKNTATWSSVEVEPALHRHSLQLFQDGCEQKNDTG